MGRAFEHVLKVESLEILKRLWMIIHRFQIKQDDSEHV